jgi:hypothetical protein
MPMITEVNALALMREGRPLMRMHDVDRTRWFVVPGGQVTDAVAEKILARPDIQPCRDGLFPGCDQTFRMWRGWRAAK